MTLFGKSFGEYLRFQWFFLALTLAVGLARLVLSLAGAPTDTVKWLSVTVVSFVAFLYYSVAVHRRGFGSYRQLLVLILNQSITANLVVVLGIVIAIMTGQDNIFSIPEYSGGRDGKTWFHVLAHIVFPVIASFVLWGLGSLILFVTKKVAPAPAGSERSVRPA